MIIYDYRNRAKKKTISLNGFLENLMITDLRISDMSKAPTYDGPFELLHELPEHRREMFAKSGVQWLIDVLESMKQPIEQMLDFERRIPYGAPWQPHRNLAICLSCARLRTIFGQPPTSTPRGHFVLLCELALDAIGLRTEGLEKAVARILRRGENTFFKKTVAGTHRRTSAVGAGCIKDDHNTAPDGYPCGYGPPPSHLQARS